MTTANKLTILRVLMIPAFLVVLYWGFPGSRYVALGVYILACLTDLLDGYVACGKELPFYRRALLVIDEHTTIEGRHIFDQDNKGWKAVSNAIKGRVVPDDDQHTLAVALLSTKVQERECCHITLLHQADAHDFFAAYSSDYARDNFYSGRWC